MKIPVKYSAAEAQALIAQKMRDKSLTFGEKRELEDQYAQLSERSFAKGGVVTKGNKMATKKIVEGKEIYASKAAMKKHEKKEPMKKEKAEEKMGKGKGVAILIAPVKKMANGGMAKKKMY